MFKARMLIVFTAFGILVGVAFVSNYRLSSRITEAQEPDLKLVNKTQSFRIVSTVRENNYILISFKNDYDKPINAFTLSSGPNSGVQIELTHNDNIILPGATYDYRVLTASLNASSSGNKALNLTVLNVVFEDGTGDGDPKATEDIQNRRRGEKLFLMRLIPVLDKALKSDETKNLDDMQQLEQKIIRIAEDVAKEQSGEAYGGVLHGKGYILSEIRDLEQREKHGESVNFGAELTRVKERYGRKADRLNRISH